MAKKKSTSVKALEAKSYSEIEHALNLVKCTLACASVALGKAQDSADDELAAQTWAVINACVLDLGRVEVELEDWHMAHEHSPKDEVAHAGAYAVLATAAPAVGAPS